MSSVASLENRLAILDEWVAQGLAVRLCPDTHVIQWKGLAAIDEWKREHLASYKGDFTEALRFRAGLCMACGLDAAKHPQLNPKWPPMWCAMCYARSAWERFCWGELLDLKGGPSANRETKRDPFDGIEDADFTEEPTSLF